MKAVTCPYTLIEVLVAMSLCAFVITGLSVLLINSTQILNDIHAEVALLEDSIIMRRKLVLGMEKMRGLAELTKEKCEIKSDAITSSGLTSLYDASKQQYTFEAVSSSYTFNKGLTFSSGDAGSSLLRSDYDFEMLVAPPKRTTHYGLNGVEVVALQYMTSRTIGSSKYFNIHQIEVPLQ